jgi:hypothetical protein
METVIVIDFIMASNALPVLMMTLPLLRRAIKVPLHKIKSQRDMGTFFLCHEKTAPQYLTQCSFLFNRLCLTLQKIEHE